MSSNFDRLPKMGGVYYWLSNQKVIMEEVPYRQSNANWNYNPVTIPDKVMSYSCSLTKSKAS